MIPKIIHQIWLGQNSAPNFGKLSESWRQHNPDWEYKFWSDSDTAEFVELHFPEFLGLFQKTEHIVQKTDIARYLLLHHFGGLYADNDTECLNSLESLVTEDRVILCQEPIEHWAHAHVRNMDFLLCNATMASPSGHPFWDHVLKVLVKCRHAKKSILDATGPLMLTGALESYKNIEDIAVHSCHLFCPMTKFHKPSKSAIFGPLAPTRLSSHMWQGSWFTKSGNKRSWFKKRRALARYNRNRGAFLTKRELEKEINSNLLTSALPNFDSRKPPHISILIPVRNAGSFLRRCFQLLNELEYPNSHIKLVFCEGDSSDNTWKKLERLTKRHKHKFKDIILTRFDTGNQLPRKNRWKPAFQKQRRSNLSKVRNHLVDVGLEHADDWALFIDVDVCEYAPDTLNRLLSVQHKIVVPNCVKIAGGECFDHNSFLDIGSPRDEYYYQHAQDGYFHPPKNYYYRRHFDDLRYLQKVPLTGVGGTMLLVHSSLFQAGLRFPEIPYEDLVETEGFGKLASDFGVQPIGLPNLEILHVNS